MYDFIIIIFIYINKFKCRWMCFNEIMMICYDLDDAMIWLTDIHIYVLYDDDKTWGYDFKVMLRSTIGSYEWTYVEVAFGKIGDSLDWGCVYGGDFSLGREIGVLPWCIIAWLTYPSQHQCQAKYIVFFGFNISKIYTYYVFKCICIIKRTLVVSDFVLVQRHQRRFFDQLVTFKGND